MRKFHADIAPTGNEMEVFKIDDFILKCKLSAEPGFAEHFEILKGSPSEQYIFSIHMDFK